MFISAFSSIPRWNKVPNRRPTRLAGMRKTGTRMSATSGDLPTQDEHDDENDDDENQVANDVRK